MLELTPASGTVGWWFIPLEPGKGYNFTERRPIQNAQDALRLQREGLVIQVSEAYGVEKKGGESMYKITVFQLKKPATEADNEAQDVETTVRSSKQEVLAIVEKLLPTLGGTHGRWIEIAVD